jgi:hypothetical protein
MDIELPQPSTSLPPLQAVLAKGTAGHKSVVVERRGKSFSALCEFNSILA